MNRNEARSGGAPALCSLLGRAPNGPRDDELLRAIVRGAVRAELTGLIAYLEADVDDRPLGALFPGLGDLRSFPLWQLVATHAANILRRARIGTWEAIATVTPHELRQLPKLGKRSFAEILEQLIVSWARGYLDGSLPSEGSNGGFGAEMIDAIGHIQETSPPGWLAAVADLETGPPWWLGAVAEVETGPQWWHDVVPDIEIVLRAMWTRLGANTPLEGIRRWPPPDLPNDVSDAVTRLQALEIASVLRLPGADEKAWRLLLEFDDVDRIVLRDRIFSVARRPTLAEVGDRLGLTREGARQREKKVLRTLTERVERDPGGQAIAHVASAARHRIGDVASIDVARDILAGAAAATSATDDEELDLRVEVLRWLAGPYEVRGSLVMTPVARAVLEERRSQFAKLEASDLIPCESVDELLTSLGAPNECRPELIGYLGVLRTKRVYVPWRRSLGDRAVAVLAATGHPMTMMQVHQLVGFEANPRSLANIVQGDSRCKRLGKDFYGLRSWGGQEYSGILTEIEQAIERAGGRVQLDELVTSFAESFGVTAQSVRSNAGDWRFIRDSEGGISMRGADIPEVVYQPVPIELTPGAYCNEQIWHARFAVDFDLLRGSGRPLRLGVALAAGLEPGLTFGCDYEGETVTFSWRRRQPTLGTLRRVAVSLGCAEGDYLFLPLDGTEPRKCHAARGPDLRGTSGLSRLALEMGITTRVADNDFDTLTAAVGLPQGADLADLADRLRERGEEEMLALLPEGWA